MIAVTPKGKRAWCSAEDLALPVADRTYWLIQDLVERDRVRLQDSIQVRVDPLTGAESQGLGTRIYMTLKAGLVGIAEGSKFPDEDGEAILFKLDAAGTVHDEFLGRISWSHQQEIFVAIMTSATMEEEEKEQ